MEDKRKELEMIRKGIKEQKKLQETLEEELHNQNTELRKLQKKLYEKVHKQNTEVENTKAQIGELPLRQQRIAYKLVEEQERVEGQFKRQGRSIKERQELTEMYEKLLKDEREREQFVEEKQLNKEILNFIEYIYGFKDTFIRSFDRYSQYLGKPDVSEIELLKDFLEKVWLNDYDKNLTYYFETYKKEELKENIIDFVDLQCSPEFVQRYILIYEKFKEIRLNERLTYFETFSENFCSKNKKEDTKETKERNERLLINFADLQKKREGEDIPLFLKLIYDDRLRLIDEFNLIKSTTKMNYFEYILRILINTFNSYKLVVNSALSWVEKKDFSVLKKINCEPDYKNKKQGFCLDEIGVYNDINNLIDKFNILYKKYKKIRYSTTKDSEEFEKILINLINIFVDLQEKINKSKHFDISAKQADIIKMATQKMHTKQGGNPPKYKSSGITVYILYKNNKYKRTIYMKDKRNTKYCKIDGKYILLSKLNVLEVK